MKYQRTVLTNDYHDGIGEERTVGMFIHFKNWNPFTFQNADDRA
jgi:hypothetical protein